MQKLLQQYRYHVWATEQLTAHLKTLSNEIYEQEAQSAFPSIQKTLAHLYLIDSVWLAAISGDNVATIQSEYVPVWTAETQGIGLEEMERKLQSVFNRYLDFLSAQDDPEREIPLYHPVYGSSSAALSDLIMHVVNHGTYHRGNIATILRQLGANAVPTDYIFYLYALKANQRA